MNVHYFSNQGPARSTRRNKGRPKKEDSQQETGNELIK